MLGMIIGYMCCTIQSKKIQWNYKRIQNTNQIDLNVHNELELKRIEQKEINKIEQIFTHSDR